MPASWVSPRTFGIRDAIDDLNLTYQSPQGELVRKLAVETQLPEGVKPIRVHLLGRVNQERATVIGWFRSVFDILVARHYCPRPRLSDGQRFHAVSISPFIRTDVFRFTSDLISESAQRDSRQVVCGDHFRNPGIQRGATGGSIGFCAGERAGGRCAGLQLSGATYSSVAVSWNGAERSSATSSGVYSPLVHAGL